MDFLVGRPASKGLIDREGSAGWTNIAEWRQRRASLLATKRITGRLVHSGCRNARVADPRKARRAVPNNPGISSLLPAPVSQAAWEELCFLAATIVRTGLAHHIEPSEQLGVDGNDHRAGRHQHRPYRWRQDNTGPI